MSKIKLLSILMILALVGFLLVLQGPGVAQSKAPMGITVTPPGPETTEPSPPPPTTEVPPTPPTETPPPVTTVPPIPTTPGTPPPITTRTVVVPSDNKPSLPGTGMSGIDLFSELFSGRASRLNFPAGFAGIFLGSVLMVVPSRLRTRSKLTIAILLVVSGLAFSSFGPLANLISARAESIFSPAQGAAILTAQKAPDHSAVVRVEIPALSVKANVQTAKFTGETWDIAGLGNQVGWLENTSLPGDGGNTVLAGHLTLDDTQAGPFRHLLFLQPGDEVRVYTDRKVYTYKVRDQILAKPQNTRAIAAGQEPQLTLLTCSQWNEKTGTYKFRRLVYADLVKVRPLRGSQIAP